ncbi:MAG: c-type cytochrome [Verrucomicrobia bacterium]|nr:c-type cytochrome [Verrucomicrobiota bacterium]
MTAKRRFLDGVALRIWMPALAALAGLSLIQALASAPPRHALSLDTPEWPRSYRLHVEFTDKAGGVVRWGKDWSLPLSGSVAQDIAVEYPAEGPPILRVWSDGALVRGPEEIAALSTGGGVDFPSAGIAFGKDVSARVQFQAQGPGTLLAVCSPHGNWEPGSKALFIRDGHLVYDIGWLGALSGGPRVDDGKSHVAILSVISGRTRIWLDGRKIADRADFSKPDPAGQILKVGRATPDFAGNLSRGRVESVRLWRRGFSESEIGALLDPAGPTVGTADFVHQPGDASDRPVIEPANGVAVRHAWVQPLETADHAALVAGWNDRTLGEGKTIYDALCVACHGTRETPGSLPTALRFAEGVFKNGSDPDSLFHTLTHGYGQMVPQNQYTTAQKYSVIQYIRETFLRPHNPSQFVAVTPALLNALPKGLTRAPVEVEDRTPAPYLRMDFGPALFWTFQVEPGNIAQKGIAISSRRRARRRQQGTCLDGLR